MVRTRDEVQAALAQHPTVKQKGGKEYLEVKYRLEEFRKDYPFAAYSTVAKPITDNDRLTAVVSVTVYPDPAEKPGWYADGAAMHQTSVRVFDSVANAETSALGRALDKLGYGTGASFEEEKDENGQVVHPAEAPRQRPAARPAGGYTPRTEQTSSNPATAPMVRRLKAMLAKEFPDGDRVDWKALSKYTGPVDKQDGTVLISFDECKAAFEYLEERESQGLAGSGSLEDFDLITGRRRLTDDEMPF